MSGVILVGERMNQATWRPSAVLPNDELLSKTGFAYVTFYVSTQAQDVPVDFSDEDHRDLVHLLATHEKILKTRPLSPNEIARSRRLFKTVTGLSVCHSKYGGADVSYRLVVSPDKSEYFRKPASSRWAGDLDMTRFL